MKNRQKKIERNTLIFSVVTGFCFAGSWGALFSDYVAFTVFPFIALIMGLIVLYSRYVNHPMDPGMGGQLFASFLVGIVGYMALLRIEYEEIGSNFIPVMIFLIAVFWIANKRGLFSVKKKENIKK